MVYLLGSTFYLFSINKDYFENGLWKVSPKYIHFMLTDNISKLTVTIFFGEVSILYIPYRLMFIIADLKNSQYKTKQSKG